MNVHSPASELTAQQQHGSSAPEPACYVINKQCRLYEYLRYADSTQPLRLMLQAWFLAYALDQASEAPDMIGRGPAYESVLFFQALDDFLLQVDQANRPGTNLPEN